MREKLIELLAESEHMSYEKKADFLIDNGVRLEEKQATSDKASKWIPVTERLPRDEFIRFSQNPYHVYPCLVIRYTGVINRTPFIDKAWFDGRKFINGLSESIENMVTHWMPLPEPPKGE